jgi:hypothetical protein
MQYAFDSVLTQVGASPAAVLSTAAELPEALSPAVLPPAALQQFEDSGFVTIPQLCGARDLATIRSILLTLFQQQTGRDEGSQFDMLGLDVDAASARQPQIIKPSIFAPELLRTQYFKDLFSVARQLLGPDAVLSFDHSILKPARSAAATPWHQDEVHHDHKYLRYRQVSFWMPLQDTPLEAGCMRYIPGSNCGALLPHRNLNDDPRIHAIECRPEYVDESLARAVPLTAGSCIAHDGLAVHSALPNVSAEDRHAYIVVFTAPPVLAHEARAVTFVSNETANVRRRARWLRRGGFLIYGLRRLRQGLRSSPGALWLKLQLLVRVAGLRAFR